VLEKLAPMNNQLLESAKLVKGLVENSTEILQQVQDTKTIVQDHGLAISVRNFVHEKLEEERDHLIFM
jgi:hypothetical protein